MSPLLFLLVVESLSRNLQALQENRKLRGLKIAKGTKAAMHAQFANDTILLGGASTVIAERFNKALSSFLKASYGKVNLKKSTVYVWNCPPRTLARIVRLLGFEGKLNWNSFSYLGTAIFKGKKNFYRMAGHCR